jgi:hypothetical protein
MSGIGRATGVTQENKRACQLYPRIRDVVFVSKHPSKNNKNADAVTCARDSVPLAPWPQSMMSLPLPEVRSCLDLAALSPRSLTRALISSVETCHMTFCD